MACETFGFPANHLRGEKGTPSPFLRDSESPIGAFPPIVIVDDSEFVARSLENFLWGVFTRGDPAPDIDGIEAFTDKTHWGCRGPLVIDARLKPHHAPPLIEDAEVTRRGDAMAAPRARRL